MSDKSTLEIALSISEKTATVSGVVAVRETVDVIVTDYGTVSASDMKLGISKKGTMYATCKTFTEGAGQYEGVLDLNITALKSAFSNCSLDRSKRFDLTLWDDSAKRMLATTTVDLMYNPLMNADYE